LQSQIAAAGATLPMYDLFISHASADKAWVERFVQRLEHEQYQGRPLRIWFDENQLEVGDRLRPELEAAIKGSRFLAVVLSRPAVTSSWVTHEWNYFHQTYPGGTRILPLLREDCDIPVLIRDLIQIDFRENENFEIRVADVVKRLCTPDGLTPEETQETVERLFREAIDGSTEEADALYAYLAELDITDSRQEGLVFAAFDTMLDLLATLPRQQAYRPTLLVAECLAARLLTSIAYARLPQRWRKRSHWTARMAMVRAYSKLAEVRPDAVDTSALLFAAIALDQDPPQPEALTAHIVRAAGKMRDTPQGHHLIRDLAIGGRNARKIAADAISIEPWNAGPIFILSNLRDFPKRKIEPHQIPEQQRRILQTLVEDPDIGVRLIATNVAKDLDISLKLDTPNPLAAVQPSRELQFHTQHGYLLPFNGRFVKATVENMRILSQEISTHMIVYLSTREVIDVYFYGASGIIIHTQGFFSHLCTRLIGADVPFAMLEDNEIDRIPDGAYVAVEGATRRDDGRGDRGKVIVRLW
jgi:hypothetical protein